MPLPLALPFSGPLFLQSLFFSRNRHKTATHGAETAMKTDFHARYANGITFVCRTQGPGFGARFECGCGPVFR